MLLAMPIREFTDVHGATWKVWSTIPFTMAGVAEHLRQGWLCFESEGKRRRLYPIPDGWEEANNGQLRAWCRQATGVERGQQNPNDADARG